VKKKIFFLFFPFFGFLLFSTNLSPISLVISDEEGVAILNLSGEKTDDDLVEDLFLENIEMVFLKDENQLNLTALNGIWRKSENMFFLKEVNLSSFDDWVLSASDLSLNILENEIKTDSFFEINYDKATISGFDLNLDITNFSGKIEKGGYVVLER
tara:strand:- start:2552 stop:3019 length:468 start_codon:yes stop_codon:yes gene_type:complete